MIAFIKSRSTTEKICALVLLKMSLLLLISFFVSRALTYEPVFSYPILLQKSGLPQWLYSFGHFDGPHYMTIAKQGYQQYQQAFFPVYPLIIRLVHEIIPNYVLAGLVISNIFSVFAYILLFRLFALFTKKTWLPWFVFYLYPTSFFLHAIYTESIFLVLLFLFVLPTTHPVTSALSGIINGATRIVGVFSSVLYISLRKRPQPLSLFFSLMPLLGLGAYCIFLWKTTGDPFYFFNSQPAFGAQRSTSLILLPQVYYRYMKIFITAQHNHEYWIAVYEWCITTFAFISVGLFTWQAYQKKIWNRLGLGIFSLAHLTLPTLTGTLTAMPRYSLMAFALFLFVGELPRRWYFLVCGVFVTVQVVTMVVFLQGHYVS